MCGYTTAILYCIIFLRQLYGVFKFQRSYRITKLLVCFDTINDRYIIETMRTVSVFSPLDGIKNQMISNFLNFISYLLSFKFVRKINTFTINIVKSSIFTILTWHRDVVTAILFEVCENKNKYGPFKPGPVGKSD